MEEDKRYEEAKAHVNEIRDFYGHVVTYLVINAILLVINLMTSPGYLWVKWPLLGWGIGIAFHAFSVYGTGWVWGRDWEERKIRQIMDRQKPDRPS